MTKKPRSHQIDPGKGKAVPEGAVEDEAADAREALGQDAAAEDTEEGARTPVPGEKADAVVEKRAARARKARSKAEAEKANDEEPAEETASPPAPDEAGDAETELEQERAEDAEDEAAGDTEEAPKRSARRRAAETTTSSSRGRRSRRRDAEEAVSVRAQAKYVRCAPRKARLVVEHIRGKSVDDARAILLTTPRAASKDVLKLLDSCVANAENNHELSADELRVEKAYVDEGPTIKRYRPRALGRATRIRKRTSHMTIYLTNDEGG
jgi:ribosomal protein L22